ncbi:MAG TPA: hypothetical protein VLA27_05555 [Paracoccaceae bacterium]|nr:hypothetical protein [Paracoccaceae bacterium]
MAELPFTKEFDIFKILALNFLHGKLLERFIVPPQPHGQVLPKRRSDHTNPCTD